MRSMLHQRKLNWKEDTGLKVTAEAIVTHLTVTIVIRRMEAITGIHRSFPETIATRHMDLMADTTDIVQLMDNALHSTLVHHLYFPSKSASMGFIWVTLVSSECIVRVILVEFKCYTK